MIFSTPKLNKHKTTGKVTLYPYYAGYSHNFVLDVISKKVQENIHILDPWSGTGLTSLMSKQLGHSSIGIDINPVMTVIAKANNISRELSPSILSLSQDIIKKFNSSKKTSYQENEPLSLWFQMDSVIMIRSLEQIIYELLVFNNGRDSLVVQEDKLSSLASFFYVALFQIIKKLVKSEFGSSNPTWIKTAKNDSQKIAISKNYLRKSFSEIIQEQLYIVQNTKHFDLPNHETLFITADSKNMPLGDNTIDFVLTSPPYCTRIDYAVAMRPELAILGLANNEHFKGFRKTITGSPTIRQQNLQQNKLWGNSCNRFLDKVKAHHSVASESYYYNNLVQYFEDMYLSFTELSRICKPNAQLGIVVQDSFYKDIHNDLPSYFDEMLYSLSFERTELCTFESNSFDNINPKSAKYEKSKKTKEFFLSFSYTGH